MNEHTDNSHDKAQDRTAAPAHSDGSGDPAFEALLERALKIPVPERRAEAAPASSPARHPLRWLAFAATVLVAAGIWMSAGQPPGVVPVEATAGLSSEFIAHVLHEPQALQAGNVSVNPADVDRVFEQAGARRTGDVGTVTYLKLCPFRGHDVAHFAVEGIAGPVVVMLLPDEVVSGPVVVREEGFEGTIVPLPIGGSMAVAGRPGEDLELIQARLVEAIQWRL